MNKFTVKDLINAGLFSVLIIALVWCGGMIGFIPVLMPIVPFCCTVLSGPAFMLYSTKINKFGMILILGLVVSLVFATSGHGLYVIPGTVLVALVSEYIIKKGEYKSIKHARWAYTFFAVFAAFNLIPMYIGREVYAQKLLSMGYGQEFIDKLMSVMPSWSFLPVVLLGCLGGYIGCTIGIKILNKHFKKAGMI